jgi:uncharacterized protein (TIGR02452 family)
MSLKGVAKDTLKIIEQGWYEPPSGRRVDVREAVERAVNGTVLYRPDDFDGLTVTSVAGGGGPLVEVTGETTAQAARRLVAEERVEHVVALNFASAKNPGGGFLGGAKAQEEDLARCSALYPTLLTQRDYYEANRDFPSLLYTDHIIYSPDVPFFRDDRLELLEEPFLCSIITAPAPNAGEVLRREPSARPAIRGALRERAGKVLLVTAAQGHRVLVLGAWGCGVFRNDPREVADAFATWLEGERFAGRFDRVVFGIYSRSTDNVTRRAFEERFGAQESASC